MKNIPSDQAFTIYHRLLIGFSLHSTSVPDCITNLHRSAHCFNIHQHKSPCDNRRIYVRSEKLVCTCMRQMSGQPTVAGTDKHNSLIFIRSKTPLYLVMTDQSASSTASVPIITAFKILTGTCTAPNLFSSIILIHTSAFSQPAPVAQWLANPIRVMWDFSALAGSYPELGVLWAQWEGWNHTAELHPLHGCVFEGVALITWPTLQVLQFPGLVNTGIIVTVSVVCGPVK